MKRSFGRAAVGAPIAACLVASGLAGASPTFADATFGDPYRDGRLVDRVDWCDLTLGSTVASFGDAVGDFFASLTGSPPAEERTYEVNNEAGCDRAKAYDDARMDRAARWRQTGSSALLWQKRTPPPILSSVNATPDFVVVGMGDSFASGEGNPANRRTSSGDYTTARWTTFLPSTVAKSESDDVDLATYCHRSSASGFASAMLELRRRYPQVNIFWRSFACSGAESRHLWRDPYVTWGFKQSRDLASSTLGNSSYLSVAQTAAKQAPQITQASNWLDTFAGGRPAVDAVYMSIGGNDVNFGGVIAACVSPIESCDPNNVTVKLAHAAVTGGVVGAIPSLGEGVALVDPDSGTACSIADVAAGGCISHSTGQRWSTPEARYALLDEAIDEQLQPASVFLAEVPDFTKADSGRTTCGDSWPGSWFGDADSSLVAHDPYARMHQDFMLTNSTYETWESSMASVGQPLIDAIRDVASDPVDDPQGTSTPFGWWRISRGPNGDTLWEGWRNKHGVCAKLPYVNSFEEAEDFQGADLAGLPLSISAGSVHPNMFGQQDYAERILFGLEKQLVYKMTPHVRILFPTAGLRANPTLVTLGGAAATTVDLSFPWERFAYPGGNKRVSWQLRVTPISATFTSDSLSALGSGQAIKYEVQDALAFDRWLSTSGTSAQISLPPEQAGVAVELRPCGPGSSARDTRLCAPWMPVGQYLRDPASLYAPAAVDAFRKASGMSGAAFVAALKAAAAQAASLGPVAVLRGADVTKVPFGVGKSLGLSAAAQKDNAAPPGSGYTDPGAAPTVNPFDQPAVTSRPTQQALIRCGIAANAAGAVAQALVSFTVGDLTRTGDALVACLNGRGSPVGPLPGAERTNDAVLAACAMTKSQFDALSVLMMTTQSAQDFRAFPRAAEQVRCLNDFGVELGNPSRAIHKALAACRLTLLDLGRLRFDAAASEKTITEVNCIRAYYKLKPLPWVDVLWKQFREKSRTMRLD